MHARTANAHRELLTLIIAWILADERRCGCRDFWRGIFMSPCSGLKAKNTLKTWTMILWMCMRAHKGHNFKGARLSWLVFSNYCVFPWFTGTKRWCYGRWQCCRGRAEQSAAPVHLCFSRQKYKMINKLFNRQSTKLSVCCLFLKEDVSA